MCGIAGALSWSPRPDRSAVERMTEALAHRGPDDRGIHADGPIALGHRRLAVIDLTDAGAQPMTDAERRCWIVFNGEIYNFPELRRELEAEGARFRSHCDTEVILEAYKRWDVACLERLNGMFAFALWDEANERLFLARDRAGEKPLYYQPLGDGLVFASELQALQQYPGVSRRLDPSALGQFLALNYVVDPVCLAEGVRKLEAAHALVAERGRPLRTARYWDLAAAFRAKRVFTSLAAAAEQLDDLLADSVRLRLVSDVPLGAFLSGGIDSSAIVAAMARLGPPESVHTFSIGFAEETYDEVPEARAAARAIGVTHADRTVHADLAAALPEILARGDEPMADTSSIPFYYLAAFARQSVTVSLSGDGGDENFAGYETYRADVLHRATRWVPAWAMRPARAALTAIVPVRFDKVSFDFKLRQFLAAHGLPPDRAHFAWRRISDPCEAAALLRPERRAAVTGCDPFDAFARHYREVSDLAPLDQAQYVDFKTWLAGDILAKVDRMTMAHALEARAPFLDHRLVEFAASLPPDLKLRGGRTKAVLKESQRPHLPASVINRRKAGFNAPVSHWLAGPLYDVGRAATAASAFREWFDPQAIDRLWEEHAARKRDHGLKLFGLTALALWMTRTA